MKNVLQMLQIRSEHMWNSTMQHGVDQQLMKQDWRYVLPFDENEPRGSLTMGMIELHVVLIHDESILLSVIY